MYFDSFNSFIDMGGHGLYVWLSYGIFLLILVWNLVLLKTNRLGALKEAKRTWQREKLTSSSTNLREESK